MNNQDINNNKNIDNNINSSNDQNKIIDINQKLDEKAGQYIDKVTDSLDSLVNTKDSTNSFDSEEIKKYKNYSILCYIPVLFVFPLYKEFHKNSKYVHFHINQGLNLTLTISLSLVISKFLNSVFTIKNVIGNHVPFWVELVSYILFCVCAYILGFGIINSINGKSKELPLVGKFRFIK